MVQAGAGAMTVSRGPTPSDADPYEAPARGLFNAGLAAATHLSAEGPLGRVDVGCGSSTSIGEYEDGHATRYRVEAAWYTALRSRLPTASTSTINSASRTS